MAELYLMSNSLTDKTVSGRLAEAEGKEEWGHVWLNNNSLESVPRVAGRRGFHKVKELYLSRNNIKSINIDHIPVTVTALLLNDNNLGEMYDFTQLVNLKRLYLYYNKIRGPLSGRLLPVGIERLYIYDNNISHVHQMAHLTELRELWLHSNSIQEIEDLPPNSTNILLSDNPLVKLNKGCFVTAAQYQVIRKYLTPAQISSLQSPPPNVFNNGWQAVQEYFKHSEIHEDDSSKLWGDDEKQNLVRTCSLRMFVGGEKEYGKSSIVRSLIDNLPYTVHADARTNVVDYKTWKLDGETTIPIYDLGGHPCYRNLSHLFHANSINNMCVIPHLITSEDYSLTSTWITDVVSRSPKSSIQLVLSQSDKVKVDEIPSYKHKYIQSMTENLTKEIEGLELTLTKLTSEKKEHVEEVLGKYRLIVSQLENEQILHIVSCTSLIGFKDFREKIIDMIQDPRYHISIPQNAHKLYIKLGTLGVKFGEDNLSQRQSGDQGNDYNNSESSEDQGDLNNSPTGPRNPNDSDLGVNNEPYEPVRYSEHTLNTVSQSENLAMNTSPQIYVSLDKALEWYKDIIKEEKKTDEIALSELKDSLQLLHDHGLLMWYNNSPQLQKVIFNKVNDFVNMLKTLFQHEGKDFFSFQSQSHAFKLFLAKHSIDKSDYEELTNNLFEKGLLSLKLLNIFAKKFHLENHLVTLVELLQVLNIAFLIPLPDHNVEATVNTPIDLTRVMFFPWYVETYGEPVSPEYSRFIEDIRTPDINNFSLGMSVSGYLPSSFFQLVCVAVYKHLIIDMDSQERRIWKQGIYAKVNKHDITIQHQYQDKDEDKIMIARKCPLTAMDMKQSWQFIENCFLEIEKLAKIWWPCLPADFVLECLHCHIRVQLASGANNITMHRWPLRKLLSKKSTSNDFLSCPKERSHLFPASLIYPLPEDDREATLCVQKVQDHLTNQFKVAREQHGTKESYPTTGPGVVAIFVNFSGHLKGYKEDMKTINSFFRDELHYDSDNILEFWDLCETEFIQKLKDVQTHLNRMENVERLFVFILSHGGTEGVVMCEQGSNRNAEKRNNRVVTVSLSTIRKMFQHDEVPKLKSKPKMFIVQTCRGSGEIQAASLDGSEEDQIQSAVRVVGPPATEPMRALGADELVCHATLHDTVSWVYRQTGSLYIQTLIKQLKEKHRRHKDIYHILNAVNDSVSEIQINVTEPYERIVWQMPQFESTLTKSVLLYPET